MGVPEINLLNVEQGSVTAPAGCGKTHLIAHAVSQHKGPKPILVLTHTNAGVAALREKMKAAQVSTDLYWLRTIDGWGMRLCSMFPKLSGCDSETLELQDPAENYPAIRSAASNALRDGQLNDILRATYARLIVDEYQDCSLEQHGVVTSLANALPTCVLGDPMQAIFKFSGTPLDWEKHVIPRFPCYGSLNTPWRWKNTKKEKFGSWLLEVREQLQNGEPLDLSAAPDEVICVQLGEERGNDDKQLEAARTMPPKENDRVVILARGTKPKCQRRFASKIDGAVTVESVDLKDLVNFALAFHFRADNFKALAEFAEMVMTNVGAKHLIDRVAEIRKQRAPTSGKGPEQAGVKFCEVPSPQNAAKFLSAVSAYGGVRTHRPEVLKACINALLLCDPSKESFHDMAVKARENNRIVGRRLGKRSVGSTLLVKGLEAEVCVILDAGDLDAENLYVAMTRGSQQLIICGRTGYFLKFPEQESLHSKR